MTFIVMGAVPTQPVIARSAATKQSRVVSPILIDKALDCFAALAMTIGGGL